MRAGCARSLGFEGGVIKDLRVLNLSRRHVVSVECHVGYVRVRDEYVALV